jgi:serine protease inhibitor ecotin
VEGGAPKGNYNQWVFENYLFGVVSSAVSTMVASAIVLHELFVSFVLVYYGGLQTDDDDDGEQSVEYIMLLSLVTF